MLLAAARKLLGIVGCLGFTIFLAIPDVRASVIQSTRTLPPTAGVYSLHTTACLLAGCIVESDLSHLVATSSQIVGGNQLVTADGLVTADVFQNLGGVPGAPIGTLTLTGSVSITYLGRSSSNQLGTFNALLTSFDFLGTFNGHTIESRLNSSQGGNSGVTSITEIPGGAAFLVDSFFDLFAELSIDGGPFVPQPERHVTLDSTVPEPASAGLMLLGLTGFAALARKARRRITAASKS